MVRKPVIFRKTFFINSFVSKIEYFIKPSVNKIFIYNFMRRLRRLKCVSDDILLRLVPPDLIAMFLTVYYTLDVYSKFCYATPKIDFRFCSTRFQLNLLIKDIYTRQRNYNYFFRCEPTRNGTWDQYVFTSLKELRKYKII